MIMISLLRQGNKKSHLTYSYLQVIKKKQLQITPWMLGFSRRYLRMNCALFHERQGFLCCQCKLGQILEFFDKLVQGDTLLAAEANNIVPPVGQTFIYTRSGGSQRPWRYIGGRSDIQTRATVVLFLLTAMTEMRNRWIVALATRHALCPSAHEEGEAEWLHQVPFLTPKSGQLVAQVEW